MINIHAIREYIAGTRYPAGDLPEYGALSDAEREYFDQMGIDAFYDAEGLSAYDLAHRAAEEVMAQAGVAGDEIDCIIYIRPRIPETFISSEATRLQYALGAERALTFALGDLGCVDSTAALRLAQDILKANRRARYVLIAYGHRQYSPRRFRMPVTIQGDGGIAALVGRGENNALVDIEIESNGRYWDLFAMEYRDRTFAEYVEQVSDPRKYGFELAVESKNRFVDLNTRLLQRNGLSVGEVPHIMMQNIARRAFDYYEMALNCSISPVCKLNLSQYGHLGCADILLNYKTGLDTGMINPGESVLLMNNSPVAAWSGVLLRA